MINPTLSKKLNNVRELIGIFIGVIVLIHLFAFGLIILSAVGKFLFFALIDFWIFFYDFFANGLEFTELPEVPR